MANYENAAQEEAPLAAENTQLGALPTWPLNVKGPSKGGGLDATKANPNYLMDKTTEANILQNMQNLADKINNPLRTFNEGMKDVQAWTQYNKSPAFSQREEAAAADRKALYDIAQQQAAIKVSQQQATNAKKRIDSMMGQGASGTPSKSMFPPNVTAALLAVDPNDVAAQQAIINHYYNTDITEAGKSQYNPASFTTKPVFVAEIGEDLDMNPFEAKEYAATGKLPQRYSKLLPQKAAISPNAPASGLNALPKSTRQNNPGNLVDPATGEIKTFPTPEAGDTALTRDLGLKLSGQSPIVKERFGPQVGNFMSPALLAETWAPSTAKGNTPESTQNYGKAIADSLGMTDPTAQIPNTPESLAKAKAAITKFEAGPNYPASSAGPTAVAPSAAPSVAAPTAVAPSAAPSVAAPTAVAPVVKPYPNPINSKQVEENAKAEENVRKKNLELRKAEELEGVKVMTAIQAKAKDRDQIRYAADTIIEEAKNNPKAFAYQQQGGPFAMAAALPVVGGAISDVYAAGAGDAKTRQRVNTAADLLGVENTKDLFGGIGARIGAQLMNVGRSAKGVGTDISAEDNLRRATFIKLGVDKVDEQAAAWKAYKDAGGTNGLDFLQSPQNRAIETKYEDILKKQFPSEYEKAINRDNDKFEYRINPVTGKQQMRKKNNG